MLNLVKSNIYSFVGNIKDAKKLCYEGIIIYK